MESRRVFFVAQVESQHGLFCDPKGFCNKKGESEIPLSSGCKMIQVVVSHILVLTSNSGGGEESILTSRFSN